MILLRFTMVSICMLHGVMDSGEKEVFCNDEDERSAKFFFGYEKKFNGKRETTFKCTVTGAFWLTMVVLNYSTTFHTGLIGN